MSEEVSLYDLLNLSIGTQEGGSVNFGALHSLLLAMLKQLDLREVKTRWMDSSSGSRSPDVTAAAQEEVEPEVQPEVQVEVQPDTDLQKRTPTPSCTVPDHLDLLPRIQTCEDGLSELTRLILDPNDQKERLTEQMEELRQQDEELRQQDEELRQQDEELREHHEELREHHEELREHHEELRQQHEELRQQHEELRQQHKELRQQHKKLRQQHEMTGGDLSDTAAQVESCCHRVDVLEETVKSLGDAVLLGDRESEAETFEKSSSQEPGDSEVDNQLMAAKQASMPSGSDLTVPPRSSTPPSSHPDEGTVGPAAPSSQKKPVEISNFQEEPDTAESASVRSGPPPQTGVKTDSAGKPPASDSNNSTPSPEAVEALRSVSKLQERLVQLEAHVAALEKGKADQTQLAQLRELNAIKGSHGDEFNNLMDQLNEQRALLDHLMTDREQNVELLNGVQHAMLQLQADCKELSETTRSLHEDGRRKERHIEELYKTTEELEGNKADKQMVESEIKADKSALEGKVSRLQFDSVTEQLSGMFHELLNKVTSQEQDWHKLIGKLSTEMECKLNRIELDSVKKQLEDRWRSINEKLQAQAAPEYEDAAGIRKQLVERFHCLSCDRPIVKNTPGPHLVTLPSFPAFPSHKSIRPFTMYTMEQLRQHYRSERISEVTDYTHLTAARSCGGGSQRRGGVQHAKLHSEADGMIQSEEVDIVGLDGRIYKGRLNVPAFRSSDKKLPTIPSREGVTKDKTKDKAKPAASPEVGPGAPLHQPCSLRSAPCSHSASSCSGRDWPVSALGCVSQSSIAQDSADAESAAEPQSNESLDL